MGVFSRGVETSRNADEIKADQSRAKLADANASTRPGTVTVNELKNRRR